MNDFLQGASAASAWIVAMFLLKFWHESKDRLLLFFSLGFLMLGFNWCLMSAIAPEAENQHIVYVVRLLAFLLILVGILDKNRRGPSSS